MLSITFKLMRRSARMLIPAGIAILIGTAFIACTFLFGNTLDSTLRRQVTASFGGANYAVGPGNGDTTQAATLKELHLGKIRAVDGVEGARPDIGSPLQATNGDTHSVTYGVPMSAPTNLMPLTLTQGSWPQGRGEVALPAPTAVTLHVNVGDSVTLNVAQNAAMGPNTKTVRARVVGLTEDRGAYSYYNGAAVMTEHDFIDMIGTSSQGGLDGLIAGAVYLAVKAPASSSNEQVLKRVNDVLPSGFKALSRQKMADETMKNLSGNGTNIIKTFLLVFGSLAMFVAALVIANAFQVLVAQRRRTLALLRTIGAKKGQLYRSVIMEACILGLIASALGIALGVGMMGLLHVIVGSAGGVDFDVVLSVDVFWIPALFGVAITVLASLGSARTATSVTPLEALRPMEISGTRRSGRIRLALSILLMVPGIAAIALAVWRTRVLQFSDKSQPTGALNPENMLMAAVGGVVLLFIGLLLCASRWLPWLLRGAGVLVSRVGPASAVAAANIQKNPRRVAATGAALLIGVTLVSCLGTGAASAKASMAGALDTRYSVDVQVTGSKLDRKALANVKAVPGVGGAEIVPVAQASWPVNRGSVVSTGVELFELTPARASQVMNTDVGSALADDAIVIPKVLAESNAMKSAKLKDGESVPLEKLGKHGVAGSSTSGSVGTAGSTGEQTSATLKLRISDFRSVSTQQPLLGLVTVNGLKSTGITADSEQIWVKSDGTRSAADLSSGISDALSSYPSVAVGGAIGERAMWEQVVNVTLTILVGLLAVAVLIALIGVANTLSLSVIERTRESATLRAIGMTRGQLRRSLAVEALLIALSSGLAGLVLGTLFGLIGSYVVFIPAFNMVRFPMQWGLYGLILGVATFAALIASVAPARRAVRTPPVAALAEV